MLRLSSVERKTAWKHEQIGDRSVGMQYWFGLAGLPHFSFCLLSTIPKSKKRDNGNGIAICSLPQWTKRVAASRAGMAH